MVLVPRNSSVDPRGDGKCSRDSCPRHTTSHRSRSKPFDFCLDNISTDNDLLLEYNQHQDVSVFLEEYSRLAGSICEQIFDHEQRRLGAITKKNGWSCVRAGFSYTLYIGSR